MISELFDENGALLPDRSEAMASAEWYAAIRERLSDLAPLPGDTPGTPLHYPLVGLFESLSPAGRVQFQLACLRALNEALYGRDNWSSAAACELLALVNPVLVDAPFREDTTDLVLGALRPLRTCELRSPLLAALLELRYVGSPSFWREQGLLCGEEAVPIVFLGLSRLDLHRAFEWLATVDHHNMAAHISALLPYLCREHGASVVRGTYAQWRSELNLVLVELMDRYFADSGFHSLTVSDRAQRFVDRVNEVFKPSKPLTAKSTHAKL